MPIYRVFGLDVESDFPLPLLPPGEGAPEVEVRRGGVPPALAEVQGRGACFEAGPGEAIIKIPVGRFHVSGGTRIAVEPAPEVSDGHLPVFILNLCLGILLQQRGSLVLHASAVEVEDGCIALAGASAAGKSALAAQFRSEGHRVLTDEICLVEGLQSGEPSVRPGPPFLQLWGDAVKEMGVEAARLAPVRPELQKYFNPLEDGWCGEPRVLRGVYVLSAWNRGKWELEPLSGERRFEAFAGAAFREEYLVPMGLKVNHFRHTAALAREVRGGWLRRPPRPGNSAEPLDLLLGEWARGRVGK